jgi:hypothetical protein
VKIVVSNARSGANHERSKYAAWVADQQPTVAIISEAHDVLTELQEAGDVHAGVGSQAKREVAVVTSDAFTDELVASVRLTNDMHSRVAPARYVTRVRGTISGRKVSVFSVHANAAIQNAIGGLKFTPGAKEWGKTGLPVLEELITADRVLGYAVIVGGDFNWRDRGIQGQHSPKAMFERLGLAYYNDELLWLAWDPLLMGALSHTATSKPPPGSDHIAMLADLVFRKEAVVSRFPGATWRPVARYQPGGSAGGDMSVARRLVLHTAVSSTDSLFGQFDRAGNPVAHFYVDKAGKVEQYVDCNRRASAVLDGNPDCITVETWDGFGSSWDGHGNGPEWKPEQVESLAKIAAWCHTEHGIPLERLPSSKPGTTGIGWHRLGCDGNYEDPPGGLLGGRVSGGERWSTSAGKVCPTTTRIHQVVDAVIPRAIAITQGDDMPLSDDDIAKIGALIKAEVKANMLDVGKQAKWSDDTVAKSVLSKLDQILDNLNGKATS